MDRGCEVTLLTHQPIEIGLRGRPVLRVPLPGYLSGSEKTGTGSRHVDENGRNS